jgi:hypothetical protein
MHAFVPFLAFLLSLLSVLVGYLAARIVLALVILGRRQSFALVGSSAPPLFASSCPGHGRPLPSTGQGGAASSAVPS